MRRYLIFQEPGNFINRFKCYFPAVKGTHYMTPSVLNWLPYDFNKKSLTKIKHCNYNNITFAE